MIIPTLDQTEGIWIGRTAGRGYHYVRDVFPGDSLREEWHRANCQALIAQGHLQAEDRDDRVLAQAGQIPPQRYRRIHT